MCTFMKPLLWTTKKRRIKVFWDELCSVLLKMGKEDENSNDMFKEDFLTMFRFFLKKRLSKQKSTQYSKCTKSKMMLSYKGYTI